MRTSFRQAPAPLQGMMLPVTVGLAGVMMLLAVAVARHDAGSARLAAGLAVLLATGGAMSAVAYRATSPLRDGGGRAAPLAWFLVAAAPVVVLWLGARVALPHAGLTGTDAARAMALTGGRPLAAMLVAALLFALLVADAAITDEPPTLLVRPSDDVRRSTLLLWVSVALVASAVLGVLPRDTALRFPEDAVDARRILDTVRAEAHLRPGDAHSQLALAITYMELHRYADAESLFHHTERLDATNAHPYNALGWMLNQEQRFADAVPQLETAVRLVPDYGEAQHSLAWAYYKLGRFPQSESSYRDAVRLLPGDAQAAVGYAWALFQDHRGRLAIAQALRATRLAPGDPEMREAAGWFLRNSARLPEAAEQLKAAVRIDSSRAWAWRELGVTEMLMQQPDSARRSFAAAFALDSSVINDNALAMGLWRAARRGEVVTVVHERRRVTRAER